MTLSFDPDSLDPPRGHFIDGALVRDREALTVHRPSDRAAMAAVPCADAAMVDRAVRSGQAALARSGWARGLPRDRTRAITAWADLIEAEAATLARLEAVCSTRPVAQLAAQHAAGDIAVTADQIRFFAEMADKEGGDLAPTRDASLGMVVDEPIGVVGAITPWNFPVSMAGCPGIVAELSEGLEAAHAGLDAASGVIDGPSFPDGPP